MAVAEFRRDGARPDGQPYRVKLDAYTLWYDASWPGLCFHTVSAVNGNEAKKTAMADHRAKCIAEPPK